MTYSPPCRLFLLVLNSGLSWSQTLVIQHVTVIDATGRSPQPNVTVTIEGDRIAALRGSGRTRIPKHAQVVNGAFL